MISEKDFRIDIYSTNAVRAVRVTHIPTGFVETVQDQRTLRLNYEEAMRRVVDRVLETM